MIIKNGMLTSKSKSDFDFSKNAEYFDELGFEVADKRHKNKLKKPRKIRDLEKYERYH